MQKIDYKQMVELFTEELNSIASNGVRMHKGLFGRFKHIHTEIEDAEGVETLSSMFYYEDTKIKPITIFALRRKYEIPKELTENTRFSSEELKNMYFEEWYRNILRWALFGRTTDTLKDNKGNTIQAYSLKDIIEGNYELSDTH